MRLDFREPPEHYAPLIAFCGGDGTGKTTLQDTVMDRMRARGIPLIETLEPTTWWRNDPNVRRTVFGAGSGEEVSARAVAYFSLADRLNHLDTTVVPALSAGTTVVSNRYVLDLFAHYMATGEVDLEWLRPAAAFVLRPTYVCVLVGDPAVVVDRVRARDGDDAARYDQSLSFVAANMKAFAELGNDNGFVVLDSTESSPSELADRVERDLVEVFERRKEPVDESR